VISWHAVALHLADRGGGCALLDGNATIQMLSASLETLLGSTREQTQGRAWVDAFVSPADARVVRERIERALCGTLRSFECVVVTAKNTRVKLSFDANLVGRRNEQGLLLTVTSAETLDASVIEHDVDVDYVISGSRADFGQLLSVTTPTGQCQLTGAATERCYSMIHGFDAPCANCPALLAANDSTSHTMARQIEGRDGAYEVVTAEPHGSAVRVRLRRISERSLTAIYESKVRALASAAQLSERERAVLTYLLMGRSLADIATILNISTRTVKFHQSNVLEKVGADSRADLVRLVS
jgi:DNA-binding CsgD family transcriptional regulator